jgi:D-tyrosyl-tRNA(Tyr) deacylase
LALLLSPKIYNSMRLECSGGLLLQTTSKKTTKAKDMVAGERKYCCFKAEQQSLNFTKYHGKKHKQGFGLQRHSYNAQDKHCTLHTRGNWIKVSTLGDKNQLLCVRSLFSCCACAHCSAVARAISILSCCCLYKKVCQQEISPI